MLRPHHNSLLALLLAPSLPLHTAVIALQQKLGHIPFLLKNLQWLPPAFGNVVPDNFSQNFSSC